MKISDRGLAAIVGYESLQMAAYPDPGSDLYRACLRAGITPTNHGYRALEGWEQISAEPITIGVGHTEPGKIKLGDTCTQEQALAWLRSDIAWAEAAVNNNVLVPLDQHQFDALVSFVFNAGGGQFGSSTLLRLLNEGKYGEAAAQFGRWTKAGGKDLPGLIARRRAERAMFEGKDA